MMLQECGEIIIPGTLKEIPFFHVFYSPTKTKNPNK